MKQSQSSLPANRAFVVQLHKDVKPALGDVRGRVEHLVSFEADHFASIEELQAFMSRILTAQDEAGESS